MDYSPLHFYTVNLTLTPEVMQTQPVFSKALGLYLFWGKLCKNVVGSFQISYDVAYILSKCMGE